MRTRRAAVTAAALVALTALVFAIAGPVAASARHARETVPQSLATSTLRPLFDEAPADPPGTVAASPPACTSPVPIITFGPFHCYRPADIAAAYGVDQLYREGLTGKDQTIVIVDPYGSPTAQQDLDTFSDTFGLPRTTITTIYPTGTPPYNNSVNGSQLSWAIETSIDLQSAHAIAPDAHLVLIASNPAETQGVQGFPSIFIGEQYAVTHYPGSVISQSWGSTEQSFQDAAPDQVARFDDVYQQAQANGITVLAASGDTGTVNFDKQGREFPFPTVSWPSSDPLVTSVGGTWLQYGWQLAPTSPTDLSYVSAPGSRIEAVWKEPARGTATGGGLSTLFPTPAFQSGVAPSLLQGSRGAPDISWNAARDGGVFIYTSFPNLRVGWHLIGGTSASTPQIAGLIALVNELAGNQGKGPAGYLNPTLYQLAALHAGDFHDIVPETFRSSYPNGPVTLTLDSNKVYGSSVAGYKVTPGYDLATGWGSPDADSFVHDLVNLLP